MDAPSWKTFARYAALFTVGPVLITLGVSHGLVEQERTRDKNQAIERERATTSELDSLSYGFWGDIEKIRARALGAQAAANPEPLLNWASWAAGAFIAPVTGAPAILHWAEFPIQNGTLGAARRVARASSWTTAHSGWTGFEKFYVEAIPRQFTVPEVLKNGIAAFRVKEDAKSEEEWLSLAFPSVQAANTIVVALINPEAAFPAFASWGAREVNQAHGYRGYIVGRDGRVILHSLPSMLAADLSSSQAFQMLEASVEQTPTKAFVHRAESRDHLSVMIAGERVGELPLIIAVESPLGGMSSATSVFSLGGKSTSLILLGFLYALGVAALMMKRAPHALAWPAVEAQAGERVAGARAAAAAAALAARVLAAASPLARAMGGFLRELRARWKARRSSEPTPDELRAFGEPARSEAFSVPPEELPELQQDFAAEGEFELSHAGRAELPGAEGLFSLTEIPTPLEASASETAAGSAETAPPENTVSHEIGAAMLENALIREAARSSREVEETRLRERMTRLQEAQAETRAVAEAAAAEAKREQDRAILAEFEAELVRCRDTKRVAYALTSLAHKVGQAPTLFFSFHERISTAVLQTSMGFSQPATMRPGGLSFPLTEQWLKRIREADQRGKAAELTEYFPLVHLMSVVLRTRAFRAWAVTGSGGKLMGALILVNRPVEAGQASELVEMEPYLKPTGQAYERTLNWA